MIDFEQLSRMSTAPVSGEAYPVRLQSASELEKNVQNDRFLTCRFDFRSADIDAKQTGSLEIDPVAHSASVRFAVRAVAKPFVCHFHLVSKPLEWFSCGNIVSSAV